MDSITMEIKVKIILMLILELTRLAFAQQLNYCNMQKIVQHSDECDFILLSHSGTDTGGILDKISLKLFKN